MLNPIWRHSELQMTSLTVILRQMTTFFLVMSLPSCRQENQSSTTSGAPFPGKRKGLHHFLQLQCRPALHPLGNHHFLSSQWRHQRPCLAWSVSDDFLILYSDVSPAEVDGRVKALDWWHCNLSRSEETIETGAGCCPQHGEFRVGGWNRLIFAEYVRSDGQSDLCS